MARKWLVCLVAVKDEAALPKLPAHLDRLLTRGDTTLDRVFLLKHGALDGLASHLEAASKPYPAERHKKKERPPGAKVIHLHDHIKRR